VLRIEGVDLVGSEERTLVTVEHGPRELLRLRLSLLDRESKNGQAARDLTQNVVRFHPFRMLDLGVDLSSSSREHVDQRTHPLGWRRVAREEPPAWKRRHEAMLGLALDGTARDITERPLDPSRRPRITVALQTKDAATTELHFAVACFSLAKRGGWFSGVAWGLVRPPLRSDRGSLDPSPCG